METVGKHVKRLSKSGTHEKVGQNMERVCQNMRNMNKLEQQMKKSWSNNGIME